MSVKAYIEKAQEILTSRVNTYRSYIEANPYPADEIQKAIDSLIANNPTKYKTEELSIPKVWGKNGLLTDDATLIAKASAELAEYTKLTDPNKLNKSLEVRLTRGLDNFSDQKKLDENQKLLDNIDLFENDLVSKYETLITKVNEANAKSKTPVPVDGIFLLNNYNFKSYLKKYTGGLEYANIFPSDFSIVPAFRDLHERRKAEVPKVVVSNETSPINKVDESATNLEKPQANPINPIAPPVTSTTAPTSPINNEETKKSESTETAGTTQASVTSKQNEVANQVKSPTEASPSPININLESKTPANDVTKGEIFNSSSNTSTTNNTTTASDKSSDFSKNTNTSQVSTTTNSPAINSDNKKSVFGTVVKNLTKNAVDSLNITNNQGFAKNLGNYLEVGKEKFTEIANPVINTYNTVKTEIDKAKNESTNVTNTRSAVNNQVSNKSTNQKVDNTSTQTTNSQVTVDAKSPIIPKDTTLAAPKPVENKTSLIETSSQREVKNNNEVTYKESTQMSPPKQEKKEDASQQTVQQGSQVNINMGELINEMRAIKLLLMSGIDVTHK